jgi:hypothetical protein
MRYLILTVLLSSAAQANTFSLISCNVSYVGGRQAWVGTYQDWAGNRTVQIFPASQYTYCPISI